MSNKSILISFILIITILFFGIWLFKDSGSNHLTSNNEDVLTIYPTDTVTKRAPFAEPRTPPSGQYEYRNEFHRFQLLYPDHLTVSEEKVAAGTTLITFESSTDSKSFQVFIIPHGDPHITDHRLEKDLPSGVMESPEDIVVAGAKGTAFLSTDPTIGSTREIWFIKNGFLYEVTTIKDNEVWLSEILKSWMFL